MFFHFYPTADQTKVRGHGAHQGRCGSRREDFQLGERWCGQVASKTNNNARPQRVVLRQLNVSGVFKMLLFSLDYIGF